MTAYIIRRLLLLPLLLVGVTVMIFGMLQFLSPVERSALYVRDIPHTEGAIAGIIKRYGLDEPIYIQYWRWLVGRVDPVNNRARRRRLARRPGLVAGGLAAGLRSDPPALPGHFGAGLMDDSPHDRGRPLVGGESG